MTIDLTAAERFIYDDARLLDRHRLATLLRGARKARVIEALRPYRNDDGGFGHALEPDLRGPSSEPASTLHGLEVLAGVDAHDDPMVADAAAWIGTIAVEDGGVPMVMPDAAAYPHAPWMVPTEGGSFLTCALAAALLEAGGEYPWLEVATPWCWASAERTADLSAYWLKFALRFLDAVADGPRAAAAIEALRSQVDAGGFVGVPGGTDAERLSPLDLSPLPNSRSRALFTDAQVEADLAALEAGQGDDGGWTFDWLAWSPGQAVEWRGAVTVRAIETLRANGRV